MRTQPCANARGLARSNEAIADAEISKSLAQNRMGAHFKDAPETRQ